MALPDMDGAVAHSFGLRVDGLMIKSITEVSGLKWEQDVVELKQNGEDGKYSIKKLPGKWKSGEVTLTRPKTADNCFEKWIKDAQLGKMGEVRKNGAIELFDYEGNSIKRYNLTNTWAKSLEISTLKAGDTGLCTEKLVLTYERLEVE